MSLAVPQTTNRQEFWANPQHANYGAQPTQFKGAGVPTVNTQSLAQQAYSSISGITSNKTSVPTLSNVPTYNGNATNDYRQNDIIDRQIRDSDYTYDKSVAYDKSLMGQADPYIKGGTALINGAASLASIYTGLEQLSLMKKADNRADEAWQMQKEELTHLKSVRARNNEKMAKIQSDPNSMYYSGA